MDLMQEDINLIVDYILQDKTLSMLANQEKWGKLFDQLFIEDLTSTKGAELFASENQKDGEVLYLRNSFKFLYYFFQKLNVDIIKYLDALPQFAFYDDIEIKSIELSENIKEIKLESFKNCDDLTSVRLPDTLTFLGSRAFENCHSLKIINLQDTKIDKIGGYTFAGCKSLESITLPNTIEVIQTGAFARCSSLKEIILPNNLKLIDSAAFYACPDLKQITLPKSLRLLGNNFTQSGTKDIYFKGTKDRFLSITSDSFIGSLPKECVVHCIDGDLKYVEQY